MARITLTSLYSDLDNWPGRLFEGDPLPTVTVRTATTFSLTYPATHEFPGFRVVAVGTGFTYLDGEATGGVIDRIVVVDAAGNLVIRFDTFAAGALGADLAQFASNVFGWALNGDGAGPDGKMTWNHLLSGNDVINGTSGDDDRVLVGVDRGNDIYNMLGGDDVIGGSMGNDTIYGGDGFDTITFRETSYSEGAAAYRGISVNMTNQTLVDCWGNTDTFTGIERIEGSRFNDSMVGTDGRDQFAGLRGADFFDGGADQDRVRYQDDYWNGGRRGIVVDLETSIVGGRIFGTIRDGFGQTDRTVDVERVDGTRYNDVFVGSSVQNVFRGGEGRDSYSGGLGFDVINLDNGFTDVVQTGVVVNLSLATGQIVNDGYGNTENATSFDEVWSGDSNDSIRGSTGGNFFWGNDGRDTLTGGGGNDDFYFDRLSEAGDGDIVTDFFAGSGANQDQIAFEIDNFTGMTATVRLVNGTAATTAGGTFVWNTTTDTLFWDVDGVGGAAQVALVQLTGVGALTVDNFNLF